MMNNMSILEEAPYSDYAAADRIYSGYSMEEQELSSHKTECRDSKRSNSICSQDEYSAYNIDKKGCNEAELKALYLLNNMSGMYSDKLLRIYEHFGSYEYAYHADVREYIEAGLIVRDSARAAFAALKKREEILLRRSEGLADKGIRLISMFDREYPDRLDNIKDKPPLLYVGGKLPADGRHSAAIVGSRKCSEYGSTVAEMFAAELAEHNVQIVSGLAYGIDGAAARGALRGGCESYGVLGCGINVCYPKSNAVLYDRMRQGEGGIISELPLDAPAVGYNFVLRNRIISGLSDVLIVIEAGRKSGTSITVGYALDQGREVYALPGRIDDPLGYGCNQFIKEGANIITEAADVLRYFDMADSCGSLDMQERDRQKMNSQLSTCWKPEVDSNRDNAAIHDIAKPQASCKTPGNHGMTAEYTSRSKHIEAVLKELGNNERRVYNLLRLEPQHVECIAELARMDMADAVTALMMLETMKLAHSPRHAYYQRIG